MFLPSAMPIASLLDTITNHDSLIASRSAERGAKRPLLVVTSRKRATGTTLPLTDLSTWSPVGTILFDGSSAAKSARGFDMELKKWAAQTGARHVLLCIEGARFADWHRILDACRSARLYPLVLSGPASNSGANTGLHAARPVVLDDIFSRDDSPLDEPGIRELIQQQVVMVTGAGGSIGSELCRQIARYQPSRLVLFDLSEYSLYRMQNELAELHPKVELALLAGDVKDAGRMRQVMRKHRPAVVFHAAAYKHVPLMEEENAWEAVRNNVLGTYVPAQVAMETNVRKFVLISTDKAVNPGNVMGASKRLAEMVCQAMQQKSPTPRFEIVRFGNVLRSTGSAVPLFEAQLERGQPITLTHPEMVRYFMSIPDAARLVLQAGSMGQGGEVFVMDMGEPVRIADLIQTLIALTDPDTPAPPVQFTGLRPGERLHEQLLAEDETLRDSSHPRLRVAKARAVAGDWLPALVRWLTNPEPLDADGVQRGLAQWIPEYPAQSGVKPATWAVRKVA